MHHMVSASARALFSACLLFLACGAIAACGEDEMPAFIGGGDQDAGDNGNGKPNKDKDAGDEPVTDSGMMMDVDGSMGADAAMPDDKEPDEPDLPNPDDIPASPTQPWVAFTQQVVGDAPQLTLALADGSTQIDYTGTSTSETEPSFSPDGKKLAFLAVNASGKTELHVFDFKTSTDKVVSTKLMRLTRPRWTPDGKTLVLGASATGKGSVSLYRLNVSTGASVRITAPPSGVSDTGHDVGPTGRVYFVRRLPSKAYEVFSVMYTGSPSNKPTQVTTGSTILGGVAVHPYGTSILYARADGPSTAPTTKLVSYTIEGGTKVDIGIAGDEDPAYFSKGDKLVIARETGGDDEIVVMDSAGANPVQITTDDALGRSPSVSAAESGDLNIDNF